MKVICQLGSSYGQSPKMMTENEEILLVRVKEEALSLKLPSCPINALCHMEGPARKTVCLVLPEPGSNLTSVEGLLPAALTIII